MLGVIINDWLSADEHVRNHRGMLQVALCSACIASVRYADSALHSVYGATVLGHVALLQPGLARLFAVLPPQIKSTHLSAAASAVDTVLTVIPPVTELMADSDTSLFKRVLSYANHTLDLSP